MQKHPKTSAPMTYEHLSSQHNSICKRDKLGKSAEQYRLTHQILQNHWRGHIGWPTSTCKTEAPN